MSDVLRIPKKIIVQLADLPRDVLGSSEGNSPGVGASTIFYIPNLNDGIGVDLQLNNAVSATGAATVTIDNTKVITLLAGQTFQLENVLFAKVEVARAGAGAISVDLYWGGFSFELLRSLGMTI